MTADESRELTHQSARKPGCVSDAALRFACLLVGLLNMAAVGLAVDRIGAWAIAPGVLASVPGLFVFLVGVVADA